MLEDLIRRFTQRRDALNGQRHTLAEDIRMAALEALLPEELERHCHPRRSRLDTNQKQREEVVFYAEARGYVAPKLGRVAKAREDRDDPVDVGGFGHWNRRPTSKGKGKNPIGKGKGAGKDGAKSSGQSNTQKIQGQCWNCGKTGHQSKDCWARPQQQQNQGQPNSSGRGNDVKGKSKDAGALVRNQQSGSPVASSVASSVLQTETSTMVGTVDTSECTSWDLCAQEIVNPRWMTFSMDTGAGGTVRPIDSDYACEKVSGPAGRNYKTATGEMDGFEFDVRVFGDTTCT